MDKITDKISKIYAPAPYGEGRRERDYTFFCKKEYIYLMDTQL